MMPSPRSVLIVEDHARLARALADDVTRIDGSIELRFARTLGEALQDISRSVPWLVLLDLGLPDSQGLDTLRAIVAAAPVAEMRVVVTSGHDQPATIREARRLGASGFIGKSQTVEDHDAALREVLSKGVYFPLSLMGTGKDLSPRMKEVLGHLARNLSHKEIARAMDLSIHGVKSHVERLYDFFNPTVRSSASLLDAAKKAGFLP